MFRASQVSGTQVSVGPQLEPNTHTATMKNREERRIARES
jgi:hypothetical protein